MKVLIATDAWKPQINGVVTTLAHVKEYLESKGCAVRIVEPSDFSAFALPGYREIAVAWDVWNFGRLLEDFQPDYVHIATEGPIGLAARRYLRRRGLSFTTSLHTKFPEYVNERIGLPVSWGYRFLRWYHGAAASMLVTTQSMKDELTQHGLDRLVVWARGVDTDLFNPLRRLPETDTAERPVMLYAGRVAVEKNIEAFLALPVSGSKVIVGDGPASAKLEAAYPDALWVGYQTGEDLAKYYASADVFVFPSRTDTYGIVMLEAMASGVPVAGYPATGTVDVVREGRNGAIDEDLEQAINRALTVSRESCRRFALTKSWAAVGELLLQELVALAPSQKQPAAVK